jgi:hypothetical protein
MFIRKHCVVCVVDTTLSPPGLTTVTGIQVSVAVDYLLYLGRCEHRVGDAPEAVSYGTGVRTGSTCGSRSILPPCRYLGFLLPLLSFLGVSIGFGKLGT